MAVETYVAVWDVLKIGEATDAQILKGKAGTMEKVTLTGPAYSARYAEVEGESAAEVIRFVKATFPGEITGKVSAVLKSSVTEE